MNINGKQRLFLREYILSNMRLEMSGTIKRCCCYDRSGFILWEKSYLSKIRKIKVELYAK